MVKRIAVAVLLGVAAWTPAVLADAKADLDDVDHLLDSGKVEQALSEVRRLQAALPSAERLTAWEIDFRGEVWHVAAGRDCLYYQLHLSNAHKDAPGRAGSLESVSVNYDRSDLRFAIVCVDLKTGQIRWSRGVNGLTHLAVHPRTDVLYLYYERLLSLDPRSGEVLEQQDPPVTNGRIQGLFLGQTLAIPQPHGNLPTPPDARLLVYDPIGKIHKEVAVADYWLLAPDESCRLVLGDAGWDCVGVPDDKKLWSLPVVAGKGRAPLWHRGHPTFILGTERQRGVVTSIDRFTGGPRWSTVLGWGAYVADQHQLRGGGYPGHMTPLTALDEHLLALDGSGRLYFLEPASGCQVATARLSRNLLAMPFQRGGQLIVPSFNWIRSHAMGSLLHPESSRDAALRIREARCLSAQGLHEQALTVLDRLVERAPQLAAAWLQRAVACEAIGNRGEEAFSRCQALCLSGQVSDEILRSRFGVLRLYDLKSEPCWSPREVNGQVYVGTLAGDLWSVQTSGLELNHVARVDHEITSLATETVLQAVLGDSGHSRRRLTTTPPNGDQRIPKSWYTEGGPTRISPVVYYRGRQFRSMRGGAVRVLEGTEMTDLPSRLDGVDLWKIHLAPTGPLGFGNGVFELDENLRPVRWLIPRTSGGNPSAPFNVVSLQVTSVSIGLVMGDSNGAALQAYSRSGKLLNEVALGRYVSNWPEASQLAPIEDGFLFADRQLVWISAGVDRRIRNFGPALTRTSTDRWGDRWRYYGNPLSIDGCVYITDLDGHLYVFDAALAFQ